MPLSVLSGTIVNVITVLVGSLIGVALGSRLPQRYRTIALTALGLITVLLGVDAGVLGFSNVVAANRAEVLNSGTYGARLALIMIGSLLPGSILGTALRLQDRIEHVGAFVHRRTGGGDAKQFAEGFLTASVIFCIGPLTLLGCLKNGTPPYDPSYLYIKSCLDGFCSIALASALGWGVLASVLTVLVLQGGLSITAYYVAEHVPPVSLDMMNVVGGVLLLATALNILEIKRIPVADMLPSLFLPPLLIAASEAFWPGLLLPIAA